MSFSVNVDSHRFTFLLKIGLEIGLFFKLEHLNRIALIKLSLWFGLFVWLQLSEYR